MSYHHCFPVYCFHCPLVFDLPAQFDSAVHPLCLNQAWQYYYYHRNLCSNPHSLNLPVDFSSVLIHILVIHLLCEFLQLDADRYMLQIQVPQQRSERVRT